MTIHAIAQFDQVRFVPGTSGQLGVLRWHQQWGHISIMNFPAHLDLAPRTSSRTCPEQGSLVCIFMGPKQ
jgi:hypothetical protein